MIAAGAVVAVVAVGWGAKDGAGCKATTAAAASSAAAASAAASTPHSRRDSELLRSRVAASSQATSSSAMGTFVDRPGSSSASSSRAGGCDAQAATTTLCCAGCSKPSASEGCCSSSAMRALCTWTSASSSARRTSRPRTTSARARAAASSWATCTAFTSSLTGDWHSESPARLSVSACAQRSAILTVNSTTSQAAWFVGLPGSSDFQAGFSPSSAHLQVPDASRVGGLVLLGVSGCLCLRSSSSCWMRSSRWASSPRRSSATFSSLPSERR
mmetsp:Transcript_18082/g.39737  ORF Transcript_18082/g.39737 Transcript_18082/m.39737 type:complete len:272 (+) Transcript_18082:94-909(+)